MSESEIPFLNELFDLMKKHHVKLVTWGPALYTFEGPNIYLPVSEVEEAQP